MTQWLSGNTYWTCPLKLTPKSIFEPMHSQDISQAIRIVPLHVHNQKSCETSVNFSQVKSSSKPLESLGNMNALSL